MSPLRRTTPMPPRTARLGRTAGVRRRNPERQRENHERAYGGEARIRFVNALPCANCGWRGMDEFQWMTNAHTITGGTSRRADAHTIIPLCQTWDFRGCHDKQHAKGWSALGPHLSTKALRATATAQTDAAWQAYVAAHSGEEGEQ